MLILSIVAIFVIFASIVHWMAEQNPAESLALAGALGIHPSEKWGRVKSLSGQHACGLPTYFEGTFEDARATCHRIKITGVKTNLLRLSLDHPHSLSMGLVCCYRLQPCKFSEETTLSRTDIGLDDFTVWAANREKAEYLFKEADVAASIMEVTQIFQEMEPDGHRSPWLGFLMTDREITAYFPEDLTLDKRLVSALARLSRVAADSSLIPLSLMHIQGRDDDLQRSLEQSGS